MEPVRSICDGSVTTGCRPCGPPFAVLGIVPGFLLDIASSASEFLL